MTVSTLSAFKPLELAQLEPEQLIDLVAENAGLRAALALAEGTSIRRELVSQELKHRIGNLLAVVQAIARKTFRDTDEVALAHFKSRMSALAAAQAVLIDAETNPAMLQDVTILALSAYLSTIERIAISGPDVALNGRHAHALTLALHELATNAAKYGALSNSTGQVGVAWHTLPETEPPRLHVTWRETGGPPVKRPSRAGFGSRLIKGLSEDAFGRVELDFAPNGLVCTFELPISSGTDQ